MIDLYPSIRLSNAVGPMSRNPTQVLSSSSMNLHN